MLQRDLKEALLTLGEVDHALDDVTGFLQQVECDLQALDYVHGDTKFIETHLKKLSLIQKDLKNQESTVRVHDVIVTCLIILSAGGQCRIDIIHMYKCMTSKNTYVRTYECALTD